MSKEKLNENYVDLKPVNNWEPTPEENYHTKFKAYLAEEAKIEEKKVSKEVEEVQSKGFDYSNTENINNLNGQEFMKGVYYECKNDPSKTLDEVKEIVAKNLTGDSLHYVKEGQFGCDVGYTEPVAQEAAGDHASSGYGTKLKELVKESLMGGMVVTTGNPNSFAAQQAKVINSMMNEEEEINEDESIYDEDMPMDEDARTDAEEEGYLDGMRDEKYDMSKELEEEKEKDEVKDKDGKVKKESVAKTLARIDKIGTGVALEAKIQAIDEEIATRNSQLTMLDENEAMAALMDKGKIKELRKEVKLLEKAKKKYGSMYEKATGNKFVETKIVDETEE